MSDIPGNKLHLPDLEIVNFKGIHNLSISNLGRVTLLAGRNGVGKTTILEAVRVYAERGKYKTLLDLLRTREEYTNSQYEESEHISIPNFGALFFGRNVENTSPLSVGPTSREERLQIQVIDDKDIPPQQDLFSETPYDDTFLALLVTFRGAQSIYPWTSSRLNKSMPDHLHPLLKSQLGHRKSHMSESMPIISLGPGLSSNETLSRYWDQIALTHDESFALDILKITGEQIKGIAVVSDEYSPRRRGNRIVVRIQGQPERVPLKSLGDGITRLFAISLALIQSRNGFLTIDEVENGIHYSVQQKFWEIVLQASQRHNIQVFATTHSFDCVRAFARAAHSNSRTEGALVRLSRKNGELRAIEYSQEELEIASDMDIEVR